MIPVLIDRFGWWQDRGQEEEKKEAWLDRHLLKESLSKRGAGVV